MADLQDVIEKEAQGQALAEEVPEMSFEELLTQEKDTAFWRSVCLNSWCDHTCRMS
ncbi:hypothetical protein BRADI_2g06006v3 [Brachypodium distachyon]|uniref:Uncharacterized protein n=1 Tax=Brachypodium distachyon TaxID=15368 RepID=A0A2K2D763_BRADI|nr:hypothetical protein BRADI_2g06006v3 [Brachypodium distachyon]